MYIIDISCPSDINVKAKEHEKISKYSGLWVELGKMWNSQCVVVPIVVGGLGAVLHNFTKYLEMVPAQLCATTCTKITLLEVIPVKKKIISHVDWYCHYSINQCMPALT